MSNETLKEAIAKAIANNFPKARQKFFESFFDEKGEYAQPSPVFTGPYTFENGIHRFPWKLEGADGCVAFNPKVNPEFESNWGFYDSQFNLLTIDGQLKDLEWMDKHRDDFLEAFQIFSNARIEDDTDNNT